VFLIASNQQQAKAFLREPGFCLLVGAVLFCGCAVFVGVSPILLAAVAIGAWLIWYRYTKGIEPLWTEEQRAAAAKRQGGEN